MSLRAFGKACSVAWAILPESLNTILEIASREHIPDFEAVEAIRSRRMENTESVKTRNGVAVINVTGTIFRYADFFSDISGGANVTTLARDFNAALNDGSISSILLNIDSPGGEVAGINEFAQMVFQARGKKPIVAYVDGMAASAAYWIASAADEIVTDATGIIGSIGVVAAVPNPDVKSARDVQFVSSQSPKKRPNPNTESGRETIQAMVDDLAAVFIEAVARNRDVSLETVTSQFGQGGVMIGAKAVDAGLADRLGDFESTLSELAAGKFRKKNKRKTAADESIEPEAAGETEMTLIELKEKVMAVFGDERPTIVTATAAPPPPPPPDKSIDPGLTASEQSSIAAESEAAKLREQIAVERAAKAKAEAESFVDAQIAAGKLMPSEKETAITWYVTSAADDESNPLAEGHRVARFRAMIESRHSHKLTEELTAGGELRTLRADENGQTEMTEDRRRTLLEKTPVGKAALRAVK